MTDEGWYYMPLDPELPVGFKHKGVNIRGAISQLFLNWQDAEEARLEELRLSQEQEDTSRTFNFQLAYSALRGEILSDKSDPQGYRHFIEYMENNTKFYNTKE